MLETSIAGGKGNNVDLAYPIHLDKSSFKVGVLDQLFELNEELIKHDATLEALAKRCESGW
jgi:hypothetical protein